MRYLVAFVLVVWMTSAVSGQSMDRYSIPLRFSSALSPIMYGPRFFSADRTTSYTPKGIALQNFGSATYRGDAYYLGTMTSQSYNNGKLGTFYFWDVQGNLRESKFFVDIAGKNKRGLKLVFPRR